MDRMTDYISRQAAIDALNKLDVSDEVGISSIACSVQESAISAIQHLPSADITNELNSVYAYGYTAAEDVFRSLEGWCE